MFSSDVVFSTLHHTGRCAMSGHLTISDAKHDFWVKVVTARPLLDLLKGGPSLCFANLLLIRKHPNPDCFSSRGICFSLQGYLFPGSMLFLFLPIIFHHQLWEGEQVGGGSQPCKTPRSPRQRRSWAGLKGEGKKQAKLASGRKERKPGARQTLSASLHLRNKWIIGIKYTVWRRESVTT